MEDFYRQTLWTNFAAAIDMLTQVVSLCPDNLWQPDKRFFYLVYHTTIFLDYTLTQPVRNFIPVLPYTLTDPGNLPAEAVDDVIPNQFYSREEIIASISGAREKCRELVLGTSTEKLKGRWIDETEIDMHGLCPSLVINYSILDILFYSFRHVQHHVGQLNYLLRQSTGSSPEWIAKS